LLLFFKKEGLASLFSSPGVSIQMKTISLGRTGAAFVVLSLATAFGVPAAAATPPAARPAPSSAAQVEQHISRLHRDLKITPAQAATWDAFTQVMRDNAQHMDGLYQKRNDSLGTMNAMDSMKSYADIAQAHVEDLQKLQPAFVKLYESMSDAQKKTADRLFRSNPSR